MMRIPDMRRCEACLSAEVYRKRSMADGTYDHTEWLRYDGGHVRCPNKGKVMFRAMTGWVNLCGVHARVMRTKREYFPYFPPGQGCGQPCCRPAGAPGSDADVSKWTLSTWRPSKRLRGDP